MASQHEPSPKRDPQTRPTQEEFIAATTVICELIPFAPTSDLAQEIIAQALSRSIRTVAQLDHLMRVSAAQVTRWQGVAGLLEVLARDTEQAHLERQSYETHVRIEGWKREREQEQLSGDSEHQKLLGQIHDTSAKKRLQ